MLTLRKKIFISYGVMFGVFIAFMVPLSIRAVEGIIHQTMNEKVDELIVSIQQAPNDEELIRYLKDQKKQIYFRVSIINNEKKILYDSHTKRLLGPKFSQEFIVDHPEVLEAFDKGIGYHEDYSKILDIDLNYFAKVFDFHGKRYVLRTAFPHRYLHEVTKKFEIGFLTFTGLSLLLFASITWIIVSRLMRPINDIIEVITPYQAGDEGVLPKIQLDGAHPDDEFSRLANTLNSLSNKIEEHIRTITIEKNEKSSLLESLVEVMERQKEFVANASHELKTPITIIQGFAETLHDHPDLPPDQVDKVTEKIVNNCERLYRVIQDLLILSDLDKLPEHRLVRFDLVKLLSRLKGRLQEAYPESSCVIHAKQKVEVTADPELLELALFNLMENGAKYSEGPAKLLISITSFSHTLEIKVSDQGIGIPEKDLPFIFERFYTVDKARSRLMGGSGLGLSIVYRIIEKHKGAIKVSSKLNQGTIFTILLPL